MQAFFKIMQVCICKYIWDTETQFFPHFFIEKVKYNIVWKA